MDDIGDPSVDLWITGALKGRRPWLVPVRATVAACGVGFIGNTAPLKNASTVIADLGLCQKWQRHGRGYATSWHRLRPGRRPAAKRVRQALVTALRRSAATRAPHLRACSTCRRPTGQGAGVDEKLFKAGGTVDQLKAYAKDWLAVAMVLRSGQAATEVTELCRPGRNLGYDPALQRVDARSRSTANRWTDRHGGAHQSHLRDNGVRRHSTSLWRPCWPTPLAPSKPGTVFDPATPWRHFMGTAKIIFGDCPTVRFFEDVAERCFLTMIGDARPMRRRWAPPQLLASQPAA